MAWFGGNLKNLTENLTGQLSNVATSAASFTRDVIAEGTEEVADQSTELQISEDKVRRCETAIVALRAENERLGSINAELEEKAEASELQINSISSQYRSVLVEKEDQVNSLIQKQNDLQTLHHSMLSTAGDGGGMTAATSTSSLSGSAIMADSHDFDDVIWSQQEINRLSNEVGRLRAECSHWKEMAAGKQNGEKPVFQIGDDSSQGEMAELKARIKSLEEKLRHKEDESQHELSAIQDSHSHKLKTLTKKHKTDVEDYERKIESLEKMVGYRQSSSDGVTDDGNDLQKRVLELEELLHETRQQVGQLEESNYQLEKENTRLTESDRDNTRLVQTLRRKVDILDKDRSRLEREVKGHTGSAAGDGDVVANLKKDNEELKLEVEHLMKVVNRQETELEVLLGSHEQASTSAMLDDIHNAGRKFSTEEALRRSKLLKEKQQIVDKMITAGQKMSESKNTVATLEAATLDISDQAAEIVSEIGCSQHQEITADFVSSLEKENDLLKHHVSRLQNEIDELNQSCETLADDKQTCEALITNLNQKVKELSGQDPQGSEQRPSDPSQSESELTLVTGESDLDSLPQGGAEDGVQVRRHISYRRPQSPTDSSVASDLSSSVREGWTSETELSSDGGFLTEGKQSLLENSDAVSFDGEYDDSIMFAGIKEKFPEAADAFKQQLNQFEMVRADWEMEKQALEEVVIRMRDQLKEKDRILQDMTAEKGLMVVHKEHSEDLEEKVKALQDNNASLLREKETGKRANEEMAEKLKRIEGEKNDLDASISQITKAKDGLENRLHEVESRYSAIEEDMETSRGDMEQELNRTREEKEQLETDLNQLDAQHQTALEQIISSRDKLIQEIKEKESQIMDVNDKLAKQSAELEQSAADKAALEYEMEEMREDLSASRADLLDSEQMKQEQAVAMTTLRTKLQAMQDEHNESLKEFDEFRRESELNVSRRAASKQEVEKQRQADETDLPSREDLQSQILGLTEKLQSLQSKEQSGVSPTESVAYLEHELSRTHHEIEELNKSIDERDAKLQEMNSNHSEHSKRLEQKAAEVTALETENERIQEEVKSRDEVLTRSHSELMKLQADLAAIKSGAERRENAQEQERTQAEQLQKTCDDLNAELNSKKELLESVIESKKELEDLIEQKEEDVRALADENSHYFRNVEKSKDKIGELTAKVKELENVDRQLQETKEKFEKLTGELEQTKSELSKMSSSGEEHLETTHTLKEEVNNLKKNLAQHQESTGVEKENLQTKEDELTEELKESTQKISELNEELHAAELELSGVQAELESVQKTMAAQETQLSESNERINVKEAEISQLKSQIESLRDQSKVDESSADAVDQLQTDLIEKSAIINELQKELEVSRAGLESQLQTFQESIQNKDNEISRLDSSLTQLRNQKKSLDESLVEYESQIEDLQRTNLQKDEDVNRLREEVGNITTQLQQPAKQPLQNGEMNISVSERIEDALPPSSPFSKSPTGVFQGQDGSISDNEKHYEKIIQEREKEISMLQHERQSLLTSLSEKSTSTMGNSVLVDLHKNQMKVKTLESERHQMMTVLNEKTREASNLKNEVHKLVKVISAQKSALEKAQEDVKELHNASRGPRDDMQKEALHNLSRIIQDKDLEIEALKQKNTSLLEVLQSEAPSNSSQISGVLSESEKLQKENTVLKEERDQLVVSIHQKHQESLAYYEEVQRLVGIVNGEVQKHSDLEKHHGALQSKMDELTESMNQSKMELNESSRVTGSLEEELEIQKQLVEELENQVQLLDDSGTEMTKRMEELEKLEASKTNELGEKENELAHLQHMLDELKTRRAPIIEETVVKAEMAPVQLSAPPVQYEQKMQEKDAEIADLRSRLQPQQVTPQVSEDMVSLKEHDGELASVKDQLESQGHALLEMDGLVKDRSMELEQKKLEIATLRQQIDQQDQAILDQNATLQKHTSDLQQLHVDLKAKTEEANTLRHHTQQISMRLQAVEQELARAHQEITNQQHMVLNKDGELRQLQDLMSRMSAEVREKDFELTALRDKCKTLAKLVDDKDTDVQGEVRRLLGEAEAMQTQAQRFQQERDQAMMALEKCQRDLLLLQEEAAMRGGNEQKLMRELERLRNHLIQMEDTYTQEALQAEEREKELRNRLSMAEEHAHSSSSAVQSVSKEASAQIDSLQDQLGAMNEQKDHALMQLSMVQSESEEYILSLGNLQMVLEQFQQEKEASIAAEVEVYELKAREKQRIAADLLKQNVDLQERLSSAQESLDIASRLSEQLDKKEEAMERLRAEMYKKEEILEEFQRRFDEVSSSSETKVDQPLVKNLFMNYLSAPQPKKQEMMKVITNVLNFSPEDMHKAGLSSGAGGWLSGFFNRSPHPTPPATPTKANVSFSQQFVQFLESESTPKRSPRLPVDEMSQDRHHHPAFNPFSAPVPQQSPFIQPGSPVGSGVGTPKGPGAAHPFLKATGQPATPIGALQPVIASAGVSAGNPLGAAAHSFPSMPAFTPVPVREGATPGRGSPRGQAAVLGDILQ
ncbi:thyroid receptor-interacting protein 11-like isoform X2 [Strongylocentrotus purpuratus]|uniref:GRIP domain-containing protein n=1 Tax=Strongylocentrotus purpuratus TaxID=7668 RepID=A0A7M7P1G7_STRPU|nr:thyroid receptor-interacting protein 11-like isoform X2 [Strongylocentrotus purpuratus]